MNEALIKMVLKNLGVDPEEVKARITDGAKKAIERIENIDKKLGAIEADLKLLLALHDEASIKAARENAERILDAAKHSTAQIESDHIVNGYDPH